MFLKWVIKIRRVFEMSSKKNTFLELVVKERVFLKLVVKRTRVFEMGSKKNASF
jgi:hypothetical protein